MSVRVRGANFGRNVLCFSFVIVSTVLRSSADFETRTVKIGENFTGSPDENKFSKGENRTYHRVDGMNELPRKRERARMCHGDFWLKVFRICPACKPMTHKVVAKDRYLCIRRWCWRWWWSVPGARTSRPRC